MLPLELLKVIFGALSRADLEAIMLVNATFRDIVQRDFNKGPLRYIKRLCVYDGHDYEFIFSTFDKWSGMYKYTYCYNKEEFGRRMRYARVATSRLMLSVLSEEQFNLLLPHRETWRNGHVETPGRFATPSLLERAFSELLFCESMTVLTDLDGILDRSCLSLPAVRECPELHVKRAHRNITVAEVTEWLNADNRRSPAPRRLRLNSDACDFFVTDLLQQLKADFAESKKSVPYLVDYILGMEQYAGDPAESVLKVSTSEQLEIGFLPPDTFRGIRVERKLLEAKP